MMRRVGNSCALWRAPARRAYATKISDAWYDVVISGGGIVGATVACLLTSQRRLRVALFEPNAHAFLERAGKEDAKHEYGEQKDRNVSLRTSTITVESEAVLQSCGVWQRIPELRRPKVKRMVVWDHTGYSSAALHAASVLNFDASAASRTQQPEYMASVVENETLLSALYSQLRDVQNENSTSAPSCLDIFAEPVRDVMYNPRGDEWPVIQRTPQPLTARVLVATDGRNSNIRKLFSMPWFSFSYEQRAVVANVIVSGDEQKQDKPGASSISSTAFQNFLPTGPIALLPIRHLASGETVMNVVWSTSDTEAMLLQDCTETEFIEELRDALTGPHALDFKSLAAGSQRATFPLVFGHAPQYVNGRVALLGDAAHAVHPLAGQGVNLGLADAASMANRLMCAAECGRDLGGDGGAVLLNYQKDRLLKNVAMIMSIDAVGRIYKTPGPVAAAIRAMGTGIISSAPGIKDRIMRYAMGA
ncbi:Ubiquinone biosynthesis monooxygenase COQ6, mitochondrial [Porphyridium purpureum]|uniref:Ubiquinone biosynthesis monooxygenase COQ6, mitochondrial n=1 Tax=Porphyridium purpureum TaxID=35688 RepID=A0A5J4YPK6_PORPP|nr:Ubiquinone biosynthesis monooxygenase COQ6, mitochondrial [Porphyridium purpureum]|eukprot:POR5613..scf222_8